MLEWHNDMGQNSIKSQLNAVYRNYGQMFTLLIIINPCGCFELICVIKLFSEREWEKKNFAPWDASSGMACKKCLYNLLLSLSNGTKKLKFKCGLWLCMGFIIHNSVGKKCRIFEWKFKKKKCVSNWNEWCKPAHFFSIYAYSFTIKTAFKYIAIN